MGLATGDPVKGGVSEEEMKLGNIFSLHGSIIDGPGRNSTDRFSSEL